MKRFDKILIVLVALACLLIAIVSCAGRIRVDTLDVDWSKTYQDLPSENENENTEKNKTN